MTAKNLLRMKKLIRRIKMIEAMQIPDDDEIPSEVIYEASEMKFELINELESILNQEERAIS